MKFKLLIMGLAFAILTACSSINVQEVMSEADKAFETKDLALFSTDIQKLKEADNKEFDAYLNKIKENDIFNVDTYNNFQDISNGYAFIKSFSKEVPLMKDYADKQLDTFKKSIDYYSKLRVSTDSIINRHTNINKSIGSPSNKFLLFMSETKDVDEAIDELNGLSSDVNRDIISLETLDVPKNLLNQHTSYIDALKKYKEALDAKNSFLVSKRIVITSAISGIKDGNIFSVSRINELNEEVESLSNDVSTALRDLEQRAKSLQSAVH